MVSRQRAAAYAACGLGLLALAVLAACTSRRPPQPRMLAAPTRVEVEAARLNAISWTSVPGADAYRVFRSEAQDGPYAVVGSGEEATFADDPGDPGIYWYAVAAVSADGTEGERSTPVSSDNVALSQRVGRAGGSLAPTTGTVRLDIPPSSVDEPTVFTIRQLSSPPEQEPGHLLVTRMFDIRPNGTTFRHPATLTLRYEVPDELGGPSTLPQDGTLATRFWDPSTGTWIGTRGSRIDEAASTITVKIPHLSVWAAGTFTLPHGGYSSETDLCETCHAEHLAPGEPLLAQPTERETCYSCHDATGATSDVRAEFGEGTIGTSTRTSFHPVPTELLLCSSCHTGHKTPDEDIKLLRVDDAGTYLYSPPGSPIGNAFCTTCHTDKAGFDSAVHDTNPGIPYPPSGSRIKCLACHQPHGSDFPNLTTANQEDLCYSCHTVAAFTQTANDYSTADGTPVRIYHHPVTDEDQAGGTRVVECASCHDTHVVTRDTPYVDPANTTTPWTGDISSFCILCHASPSTTQPISSGPTVPYTIRMVNDTSTDADGNVHDRFSAAGWASSIHWEAGLACTDCHDVHGSSNAYLLSEDRGITGFGAISTDRTKLITFCRSCHVTSHAPAQLCTACHYHGSDRF